MHYSNHQHETRRSQPTQSIKYGKEALKYPLSESTRSMVLADLRTSETILAKPATLKQIEQWYQEATQLHGQKKYTEALPILIKAMRALDPYFEQEKEWFSRLATLRKKCMMEVEKKKE